ncbi:integrase, catalytic region, zinc finger, CCHC-type containing protein [Tanacetum coccineum]|uniref:Integrase, catalytic region, zinc finger, CCHC-type containing protein n=1 Tax=Tanacetum coccineum TaxID=301880 RepID=A0ABQ4YC28_9ASTR
MKGKYVETKFEKPSVIRQPNAFKSQRQSVLGKPATFSYSLAKTDFSKSKSVTTNNVSNDFLKPVNAQILPQNVKSILKNTNVIAPGMYKVHTKPNQTRTPQLPQDIRKTNKRVSFSTGVIPTTSVSRPQLKSNRLEDRVMHNNSEGKKQQVEDHRGILKNKFYKTREDKEIEKVISLENKVKVLDDIGQSVQTMNMLNCNCKTSSVKPEYLKKAQRANPRLYDIGCYNDNLSLMLAPESDETIRLAQESRSKLRVIPTTSVSRPQLKSNQMEDTIMHNNSQGKKQQVEDHHSNFKFSKHKTSLTACNDSLNAKNLNVNFVCVTCGKCVLNDSYDMCVLHYINEVNSRTKQPTVVPISTKEPKRNITPPGYTWKPKTYIVNVKPDASMPLGTKSRTTNISEPTTLRKSTVSNTPLSSNYFAARRDNFIHLRLWMLKAHYRKSQASKFKKISVSKRVYYVKGLNYKLFSVGQFCDANLEVAFRKSTCYIRDLKGNDLLTAWLWHHLLSHLNFDTINLILKYDIVTGLPRLKFIKDHLCSSCELGKAKCTEFLNKNLHAYFAQEGIEHQTSTARTPEQNGVVERQNRTLVEAARTMLSADKVPLFFWAEAFATSCFTQNRSLMASDHVSFDPVPQFPTTVLEHASLSPGPQRQENVPHSAKTVTTSNELDLLFSLMFNELLNGTTLVVSKSSVVTATDAPNQQNAQVKEEEFINIFSTLVQEREETSSRYVDSSNMHIFYQQHPSEHRWTKDHPLEQVIGNHSQSIRTRRQLEINGEMCMFTLTVSRTEPKNIKDAMADSAWIEAMEAEIHQFERLDV